MKLSHLPALLTVLAAPLFAQQSTQVQWWSGTWDGAFAEAKIRNVPVVVVFIQDGEEANERMASAILKDPEYVKATHKTVPVIVSREFHGSKKGEAGDTVKAVCVKFGATSCEVHQNLEAPARTELCGSEVRTPQHVLVLPDKTVVGRILDLAPVSAYQELFGKGTKKLGRGLTGPELKQVREQLRDANLRIEKEDWAGAMKAAKDALAVVKDTPFAKEADAVIQRIDTEAKKVLEAVREAEKKGEMLAALRTLESAVDEFAGTETVAALKKELNRVKGTKAGAEAARVLAKEKRGMPAFEAGQAAEKAKDFIAAKREYERAIAAASGTQLAEKASARIAALAADPDIKVLFDRADRDAKALALVKDAEKLIAAGSKDAARDVLKRVLAEYADTTAAPTARTKLEELR